MKNPIFYMGFLAVLFLSMLSCQKEASMNSPNFSLESSTQTIGNAALINSQDAGNLLFDGLIVARRTDANLLPIYQDFFNETRSIEAIVFDSRTGFFGLTVVPPTDANYATGYSCIIGSQDCKPNSVAILDSGVGNRGLMSWIAGVLGFRP